MGRTGFVPQAKVSSWTKQERQMGAIQLDRPLYMEEILVKGEGRDPLVPTNALAADMDKTPDIEYATSYVTD